MFDTDIECDQLSPAEQALHDLLDAESILRSLEDEIPAGPGKSTVNMDDLRAARKEVKRLQDLHIKEFAKAEAAANAANPDRWKRTDDEFPF